MNKLIFNNAVFEGINKDLQTALCLRSSVFGGHGEMNSALQYLYHYLNFNKMKESSFSVLFLQNAVEEMHHFSFLSELVFRLGIKVSTENFNPFRFSYYSDSCSLYSKSKKQMILDDIILERNSISNYTKLIAKIKNKKVNKILSLILLEENEHLKRMEELYGYICSEKNCKSLKINKKTTYNLLK